MPPLRSEWLKYIRERSIALRKFPRALIRINESLGEMFLWKLSLQVEAALNLIFRIL